jgi:hypothetical protein
MVWDSEKSSPEIIFISPEIKIISGEIMLSVER